MTKIKFSNRIRAVSADKRPLMSEMESIVASMKNLSGPAKRNLVTAFADAGLLSSSAVNAAAVDDRGYYDIAAVDAALKTFPTLPGERQARNHHSGTKQFVDTHRERLEIIRACLL